MREGEGQAHPRGGVVARIELVADRARRRAVLEVQGVEAGAAARHAAREQELSAVRHPAGGGERVEPRVARARRAGAGGQRHHLAAAQRERPLPVGRQLLREALAEPNRRSALHVAQEDAAAAALRAPSSRGGGGGGRRPTGPRPSWTRATTACAPFPARARRRACGWRRAPPAPARRPRCRGSPGSRERSRGPGRGPRGRRRRARRPRPRARRRTRSPGRPGSRPGSTSPTTRATARCAFRCGPRSRATARPSPVRRTRRARRPGRREGSRAAPAPRSGARPAGTRGAAGCPGPGSRPASGRRGPSRR